MNELELLERLLPSLPLGRGVRVGAGDDCAVLDLGLTDRWFLFKTDAVVEGVHFERGTEGRRVGHKALGRVLSDIAAMGGRPLQALVTLGLPEGFDVGYVELIYAGMKGLAGKYGVGIPGGETTASGGGFFLSVAMIGEVHPARCILRSGARPGDAIFVTGRLGGSIEGKHLDFEPRLREAQWLVERFGIRAMIDVSDGLARDLRHILKASGVGAEILATAIPISVGARRKAREAAGWLETTTGGREYKPGLMAALTDGEDFELLFCVDKSVAVQLLDSWKGEFPEVPLGCIGKIIEGSELYLRDQRGVRPLGADGYDHFTQSK